MPRTLPPLNAVRAFEAAARCGTTIDAASELGVTHGAVSRQIRQLEDWVGRPLFERLGGRLVLTEAGRTYAEIAGRALDLIHDGTEDLLEAADRIVRISATASFASEWLLPRLPDFQARHPGLSIWLDEDKDIVTPRPGACDLAIRMGSGPWQGVHAAPLMADRLIPVCSPQIAARLACIDDLRRVPLLHDDDAQAQWSRWFGHAGAGADSETSKLFARGSRFASSSLLLQAAAAGQGVALAREKLAEAWFASSRLVRPFAAAVDLGTAYWLITRADVRPRRSLRAVLDWLTGQAATPGAPSHPVELGEAGLRPLRTVRQERP